MAGGGWLMVQLAVLALLASALLVVWGDLGDFPFVRRMKGSVKFLLGLLAIAGMIGVVAAPNYMPRPSLSKAPLNLDWQLLSLPGGKEINLKSLKGKVLFINIWATWCPPCVAELPSIERLYERFAGRDDVAFLLISQDESPTTATRFAKANGLKAPIYFPVGFAPGAFRTESIPATFIVRKDGTLHFGEMGYKDWGGGIWPGTLEELSKQQIAPEPN